jgi:formylglycine-generating enzyme required for sulfatase activity
MRANLSYYSTTGEGKEKIVGMPADRFPVESVTWFDAVAFCNELSRLDGFPLHYKIDDVKTEKGSILSAKVTIAAPAGYRLPSEAEWEFACRAGTTTSFHYGNSSTGYESNLRPGPAQGYGAAHAAALERPTKVGSYQANAWGLFDMHGNVAEWCEDWYDNEYYAKAPAEDPLGPAGGTHRVLRGGSWMVNEANCRSASRFYMIPSEASSFAGFRIARTP